MSRIVLSKDAASTGSESEIVIDWFKKNKMVVNPDKFQTIIADKQRKNHTY